mmetsp:Transcript_27965/g.46880  ORF Transcript_27965/g.46880 Transcript_27965/m.46880 type:complete len:224 (+) Transcript_27965:481-1152(+)
MNSPPVKMRERAGRKNAEEHAGHAVGLCRGVEYRSRRGDVSGLSDEHGGSGDPPVGGRRLGQHLLSILAERHLLIAGEGEALHPHHIGGHVGRPLGRRRHRVEQHLVPGHLGDLAHLGEDGVEKSVLEGGGRDVRRRQLPEAKAHHHVVTFSLRCGDCVAAEIGQRRCARVYVGQRVVKAVKVSRILDFSQRKHGGIHDGGGGGLCHAVDKHLLRHHIRTRSG